MTEKNLENEQENEEIISPNILPINEPVITPKEDDELVIEIDDSEQNLEINDELVNDDSVELEKVIEKKLVKKGKSKASPSKEKAQADPNTTKKKGKFGMILLFLLIILIGSGAYLFFMKPDVLSKYVPFLAEKNIEISDTENSNTSIAATTDEGISEETNEMNDLPDGVYTQEEYLETASADEAVVAEITKELKKASPASTPKQTVSKGILKTPAWIISFANVSKEQSATTAVSKLTSQGLQAGYYWIPDYVSGGAQMFKVYVGSFGSKDEALAKLDDVKTIEAQAYVMEVK